MLNSIIRLALQQKIIVLALSLLLLILGFWQAIKLPVDIFPN